MERFDIDQLDDDPFEVEAQAAHLFKHPHLGMDDVFDVWLSDPLSEATRPLADVRRSGRPRPGRATGSRTRPEPATMPSDRLLRGSRTPDRPVPETPIDMTPTNPQPPATPDEEYDFYAEAENQEPQGPPRRRSARLTAPVPVRFPPEVMEQIRERAQADDRSVSAWIRRAVEAQLRQPA